MDNFIISTCSFEDGTYSSEEIGYLENAKSIKIDLNGDMDFEIVTDENLTDSMDFHTLIYRPDTEWGGILTKRKINTYTNEHTWTGWSARGLLNRFVLCPPSGQAYLTLTGEANTVIGKLLDGDYSGAEAPIYMVGVSTSNTGVNITVTARYNTLLEAIENALAKVGMRLNVSWTSPEEEGDPSIILSAESIVDYSNEIEFSQDMSNVAFTIEQERYAARRLICLGKGELTERLVVTLYLWSNGTVHETPETPISSSAPFSLYGETEIYDYPNAEDRDSLIEYGTKRLLENAPYKSIKASVSEGEDPDMHIGDIIGGREYTSDELIQEPITNKTYTLTSGKETIGYTVKGEDD